MARGSSDPAAPSMAMLARTWHWGKGSPKSQCWGTCPTPIPVQRGAWDAPIPRTGATGYPTCHCTQHWVPPSHCARGGTRPRSDVVPAAASPCVPPNAPLTSGARGPPPQSAPPWSSSRTSAPRSTSWTWWGVGGGQREPNDTPRFPCPPPQLTAARRGSWRRCPGSRAGSPRSNRGRICGWSPCPERSPTPPVPPSPCHPRWWGGPGQGSGLGVRDPPGPPPPHRDVPEVAFLAAAALLHGVQRAHAPVLLQPHPLREEELPRRLRGGRQQGPHHHWGGGGAAIRPPQGGHQYGCRWSGDPQGGPGTVQGGDDWETPRVVTRMGAGG